MSAQVSEGSASPPAAERVDAVRDEHVGVVVVHGVGPSEAGWINGHLIKRLQNHPEAPNFEDHSEVYDLPDRGRARPDRTFPAYVRRGHSAGGRRIAVMELFWADLSRIGTSPIANSLALLKLFYEAPQVLGECFLEQTRNGFTITIGALVRLANWILRWPITGLNIVAFACALTLLARQRLIDLDKAQTLLTVPLPYVLSALLVVLALAALLFARWRVHRDIALADIGMSTFVFALGSAAAILVANTYVAPEALSNPAVYLMAAGVAIFAFWYLWNYGILIAIAVLAFLAIQQAFARSEEAVSVSRPAAAVGLSVIQGVIYKIVIALLWVFIFVTLDFNERTQVACQHDPLEACAYLGEVQRDLIGIAIFNMLMIGLLAAMIFIVAIVRALLRMWARRITPIRPIWMPRMVVSPLVLIVMMIGTVFNLVIFYWRDIIPRDLYALVDVEVLAWREVLGVLLGGGTALTFAFYAFRALQHAASGVLHILRDLVDHQYSPRFTFSQHLLPVAAIKEGEHPRRARVEARLEVLLRQVVARERFDRVIFVAHSQGSVILYDYLTTRHEKNALGDVGRIDVLTLGSPLSYLYQHYFPRYADAISDPRALNPQLRSWTNMWRVDDPIGNRIDIVRGDFVHNEPLRPGGHVDYWRDPAVADAILRLIDPERLRRSDAAKLAA